MAEVTFDGVSKVYPDGTRAVNDLNLEVTDGEFMVLVGPSGCGKTTALRMVAGLEDISEGSLRIGERIVNHVPSRDRDIAMVFQSYALYPHLSVYDNIAFGLKLKKVDKKVIGERVRKAAQLLGLEDFLDRKPRALSGGQRQRVAMGRAIVREPAAFLMDEPLSNLDAKLRVQMRAEIARIQRDLRVTTIYVTHDQSEAMTLGDRVCVMRGGLLQQVDRPQVLYERPANLFVAGFIGSPAMNLVQAQLAERRGGLVATFGPHELAVPDEVAARRPHLRDYVGRRIALGIRPEDLADVRGGGAPAGRAIDHGRHQGGHGARDLPPLRGRRAVGEGRRAEGDHRRRGARGRRGADGPSRQPVHRPRRARDRRARGAEGPARGRHDEAAFLRSRGGHRHLR